MVLILLRRGCTGAVIPNGIVESDSGPMEPLTEGAGNFSVANGDSVPAMGVPSCVRAVSAISRALSRPMSAQ